MEFDTLTLFITLICSFIVKDFYDIFIKSHITKFLSNYKLLIEIKKEK
jgi:hypothetical protein